MMIVHASRRGENMLPSHRARALAAVMIFACTLGWLAIPIDAQGQSPVLMLIDEDSIDNGQPPDNWTALDVNAPIAQLGLRDPLPWFASREGAHATLHSGQPGDAGWFALRSVPSNWTSADGATEGLRNFIIAGPGLGSPDASGNRASLLTAVPDVAELNTSTISTLTGRTVCGLVFDRDVVMNSDGTANLSGTNLGIVGFKVVNVSGQQGSPEVASVEIEIVDANEACGGSLAPAQ
jgi:hypothetical protein